MKTRSPDLIEHGVKLELGAEIGEPLVAECLEGSISDHGAHLLQVSDELLQLGTLKVQGPAPGELLLAPEHTEHPLLHLEAVAKVREERGVPVIPGGFWCVDLYNLDNCH